MITDYMTKKLITVKESDSLIDLMDFMVTHRLSGIPVTDETGKLLGFAPNTALLDAILPDYLKNLPTSLGSIVGKDMEEYLHNKKDNLKAMTVKDIMVEPSYILNTNSSFIEAVKVFVEKEINRIAVVDDNKILVGILCRNNVLTAMQKALSD
jgi:CBS domain-containing protein